MKTRNLFVLLMIGYLGLGLSFATAQSSGALSDSTVTETTDERLGIRSRCRFRFSHNRYGC
jgi:hypothetical protein